MFFRITTACLAALLTTTLHAGGTPGDDPGPVAPPPVFEGKHHSAASRNAADPLAAQAYSTLSPAMLEAMVAAGLIGAAATYAPRTRPRLRPDHFRHRFPRHHTPGPAIPPVETR